jgi:hypothetical protein
MAEVTHKTRQELDAMLDELGRQLDDLYRAAPGPSHADVWAGLTQAALRLAAPEDRDHVYRRLQLMFTAHDRVMRAQA